MCFGGGGGQPERPTNPAPYSLADSHTAVKQTVTNDRPEDPAKAAMDPPTSAPRVNSNTGTALNGM